MFISTFWIFSADFNNNDNFGHYYRNTVSSLSKCPVPAVCLCIDTRPIQRDCSVSHELAVACKYLDGKYLYFCWQIQYQYFKTTLDHFKQFIQCFIWIYLLFSHKPLIKCFHLLPRPLNIIHTTKLFQWSTGLITLSFSTGTFEHTPLNLKQVHWLRRECVWCYATLYAQ